jgi:hypothetical protein
VIFRVPSAALRSRAAFTTAKMAPSSAAVHAWRVSQLTRLALASPVAEAVAGKVDWHAVAKLVEGGCPAPARGHDPSVTLRRQSRRHVSSLLPGLGKSF